MRRRGFRTSRPLIRFRQLYHIHILSRRLIRVVFVGNSSLLLAGHDTTAFSTTWLLWELARHPEYQVKVRKELAATRAEVIARGDTEFSVADLDGLSMLLAVMKVHNLIHGYIRGRRLIRKPLIGGTASSPDSVAYGTLRGP